MCFKADDKTFCIVQSLQRTAGKNVLLIIDGYDEISEYDRTHSFVANIIDNQVPLLLNCAVVVTCRSHVSLNLYKKVQHRIQISGFWDEATKFNYIGNALKPAKAAKLQQYLNSNPSIKGICYNPLILAILCYLVEHEGTEKLADTQTKIFKEFILRIIIHNLKRDLKADDKQLIPIVSDFCQLPENYFEIFKELSHLALSMLEQGSSVLKLNDIRKQFPKLATLILENPCGFGLLNAPRHFEGNTEYISVHFIHFSIQEYMAAYHINLLSDKELIKLLNNTFWKVDFYNTWIMYFGITNGASIALKRFLSGNGHTILTWLSRKDFTISDKFLNDKVKNLHLFQCFAETDNPISVCNPDQEIDLSHQKLSVDDIHAVGFFFLRSVTNCWDSLNLCNCKIGDVGLKVLIDKFSNKNSITVKKVDFSYNKCSKATVISSTTKNDFYFILFDLLTLWHTSELVVSDKVEADNQLRCKIEQLFYQSQLTIISMGLNVFIYRADQKRVLAALSDAKINAEINLYVNNSSWELDTSLLVKRQFLTLHVCDSSLNEAFVEFVQQLKTYDGINNIYIHDHSLLKETAGKVGDLIVKGNTKPPYVFVMIGDGVFKGKLCTFNLRDKLSNTEILNFMVSVRLCLANCSSPNLWRKNLLFYGNESYVIKYNLTEILQRINVSQQLIYELNISVIEDKTLFVCNMKCKDILRELALHKDLEAIYISNCKLDSTDWNRIIANVKKQSYLSILHVYYSTLSQGHIQDILVQLYHISVTFKEIFVHSNLKCLVQDQPFIFPRFSRNTSIVLLSKSELMGFQPTCKQIALALCLEPHVAAWKSPNCHLNVDSVFQIIALLVNSYGNWTELDFSNCCIGDFEIDAMHRSLKGKKNNGLTVKSINVSSNKFTVSSAYKLVEILLLWKTELLIIGQNKKFCSYVVKNIEMLLIVHEWKNKLLLTILCEDMKIGVCYDVELSRVVTMNAVTNLYLIHCQISMSSLLNNLKTLNQIYMICCMVNEQAIVDIVKTFMNSESNIQLSIHDKVIDKTVIEQLRKLLLKNPKLSFALYTDGFLFTERLSIEQQSENEFIAGILWN